MTKNFVRLNQEPKSKAKQRNVNITRCYISFKGALTS